MAVLTDPTTLPGCLVWLDSQDNSTLFQTSAGSGSVTTTGDPVGLWRDKAVAGGINRDFLNATAGDRPIYVSNSFHNKSAIRFGSTSSSSSCRLYSTFTQTYSSASIFVVAAPTNGANSKVLYSHNDASNTTDNWYYPLIQYSGRISSWYDGGYTQPTTFTLSGFDVVYATIDENNYLRMGVKGMTTSTRGTILSPNPLVNHYIGNRIISPNSTYAFEGDISEIIIYKKALSPNEHLMVQRYLAKKWNCLVPIAVATSSGNWSNPSTWFEGILPLSSDNVYANKHIITIDQDIRANSIRNSDHYVSSLGGSFVLNADHQINVLQTEPDNWTAGVIGNCFSTCLFNKVDTGSVVLSGNVQSFYSFDNNSYNAYVASIEYLGGADFTVFGDVAGGYYKTDGIVCNSNGNLTVNGNVTQKSTTNQGVGIKIKAGISGKTTVNGNIFPEIDRSNTTSIYNESDTYEIVINGDVYGGSRNSGFGIHNRKPGKITVNGNVYGHPPTFVSLFNNSGYGIYNQEGGAVTINGDVFAVQYAAALLSANMKAVNIFNGDVFNATNGSRTQLAIKSKKYKINSKKSKSTFFWDVTGGPHEYYGPSNYNITYLPPASSVDTECLYAVFSTGPNVPERKGTMKIPKKEFVMAGEPVGTEFGTAVLSADSLKEVWNYKTTDVIASDVIGSRIKNNLTIEDFGKNIANTNI